MEKVVAVTTVTTRMLYYLLSLLVPARSSVLLASLQLFLIDDPAFLLVGVALAEASLIAGRVHWCYSSSDLLPLLTRIVVMRT